MHPPTLSASPHNAVTAWLMLIGLGAFHGINPGMGWLFALSLGLQQGSERAIWLALLPIALGHALAVLAVLLAALASANFISLDVLRGLTAAVLLAFGLYKLRNYYRHPRWVGMKVGARDLLVWSFLMASSHGAGLMLVPVLLGAAPSSMDHSHGSAELTITGGAAIMLAVALHTLSMLLTMGAIAWLVYKKLGLAVLRQQWLNFDLIWAIALLVAGGIALLLLL